MDSILPEELRERTNFRVGVVGVAMALIWISVVHGAYFYFNLSQIWPKVVGLMNSLLRTVDYAM